MSVTGASARRLRIGEVAELTGTTPRTIRYYEELGLLPAALGREPGAHRVYEPEDVERLREVLRLKELLGVDLHHATVGISGFGRIGQGIARRLKGFEPRNLYCTRRRQPADPAS